MPEREIAPKSGYLPAIYNILAALQIHLPFGIVSTWPGGYGGLCYG